MKKDYKQQDFVNFIKGFAFGYFITDFIFSLFIPRKKIKRRNTNGNSSSKVKKNMRHL